MSKIVASFVQKAISGLNLAKGWLFNSVIQDTNVIIDLDSVNHWENLTPVLSVQGKKINHKINLI